MNLLPLRIRTLAPVIISDVIGGNNHISSLDYIPGAAILGAVASRFLQENPRDAAHTDPLFRRLFLSDQVLFRNATIELDSRRSFPVPMNIVRKKAAPREFLNSFEETPIGAKYYAGYSSGFEPVNPGLVINFHTSRRDHRLEGKSTAGEIFTYQGLAPHQVFRGEILGSDSDLQLLKRLLESDARFALGRSRTAQYGRVEINPMDIRPAAQPAPPAGEVDMFFIAPVIVLNRYGTASTLLPDLESVLQELTETEITITRARVRVTTIENYHRRWGAKQPADQAFAAGSAIRVKVPKGAESRVSHLLLQGIGERRNEGFGEVTVQPMKIGYQPRDAESGKPPRPGGEIPKAVMEIFNEIVKRELRALAERQGITTRWHGKLPNTLTGQLLTFFQKADPRKALEDYIRSTQTQREKGEKVDKKDKKAAQHLKRVKCGSKSVFERLERAHQDCDSIFEVIQLKTSDFLRQFPQEAGLRLEDYKLMAWVWYWKALLTCHLKGARA